MNSAKLKETMNQIFLNEELQEQMIKNVKKNAEYRRKKIKTRKKAEIAAASAAVVIGAAIPIQAGIRYLVKDRLEQIPAKELQDIRQMQNSQENVQADGFSRKYSKTELERMECLEEAYQKGTFPKQTIRQTEKDGQIPDDSLWYDTDSGTFYLPERELTDEELLQIIDFQYTGSYALEQGFAAKRAKKEWEQKEKQLKEEVRKEGGITQKEAQRIAETYLKTEFGCSGEEMECRIFLDEQKENAVWHVSFQTQDAHSYTAYGIDLDAGDGRLLDTSHASLPKRTE